MLIAEVPELASQDICKCFARSHGMAGASLGHVGMPATLLGVIVSIDTINHSNDSYSIQKERFGTCYYELLRQWHVNAFNPDYIPVATNIPTVPGFRNISL